MIEMTGKKFTRLTVTGFSHKNSERRNCWFVRCDCGNSGVVIGKLLRSGRTKSCGCLQREKAAANARRLNASHPGDSKRPEYGIWIGIKSRCLKKDHAVYPLYGGRGIRVCDRWRDSFSAFLEDMGNRPSRDYSIDRIDNNGNYEPGNCRWATAKQQHENRRPLKPIRDSAGKFTAWLSLGGE